MTETGPRLTREPPGSPLPGSLRRNPSPGTWLGFDDPGVVTVRVGKVEYGQGVRTALAQIAAEELEVSLGRIVMAPVSTDAGPDEGTTSGSRTVMDSGTALGLVCAEVRARCVAAAAARHGVKPGEIEVRDGAFRTADGVPAGDYWTLADAEILGRLATATVDRRDPRTWTVAGTSAGRLQLEDKLDGRPHFVHDLQLPRMVHGRVIRPAGPGATLGHLEPVPLPDDVTVVRDGSFLGVIAERDRDAVAAAGRLGRAARWSATDTLPDQDDLRAFLLGTPTEDVVVAEAHGTPREGTHAVDFAAEYSRPFLAHGSLAPSCGVARWDGTRVTVWSNTQGPHALRKAIALALGITRDDVTVHHVEGAGAFGHNAADDAAFDAVLLARAVPGRPVKVTWSRHDEMSWGPLAPAMLVRLNVGTDGAGRILSWTQDVWSNGHHGRPGTGDDHRLLAAGHTAGAEPISPATDGAPTPKAGSTRNAEPYYPIPDRVITRHRLLRMPIRTSAMRSLGAHLNVFAIESAMDELAGRHGIDPLEYRLAHLTDPRAAAVLRTVAERSGWPGDGLPEGTALGIGFARYKNTDGYCAVVARVEAVEHVRLQHLWIAVDIGRVINPGGTVNQIQGGALQSASWTLKERVTFDRRSITSVNWDTYPVIRPDETPGLDVVLMPSEAPSTGAGELAQGPVAAAIGNAVAAAVDIRVRDLPITTERIIELIAQ